MPLNVPQQLFLRQARSDYDIFKYLVYRGPCHRLHYLQMCTEKLAKVYAWRNGTPPGRSHRHFVLFLEALEYRPDFHEMFGYRRGGSLSFLKPLIFDLARRIEALAPAGNNGANPEYPWPPNSPTYSPVTEPFQEWIDWNETAAGRRLHIFIETLLNDYDHFLP